MTATLTYTHPSGDTVSNELTDYHTNSAGCLIARTSKGMQVILPPEKWVVEGEL